MEERSGHIFALSLTGWVFSGVITTVAYLLVSRIYALYRLRHIRGPFWTAFSKIWMIRKTIGGNMHLELSGVCDQYSMFSNQFMTLLFEEEMIIEN
jgi:hypothetical protein